MKENKFTLMKKLGLVWLISLLAFSMALGQGEICNNGIDDDGDGFIDCYDSKCSNSPFCSGGFTNNNVVCQAKPAAFPQFTMKLKWQSPDKTTNHLNRASVGDLDRDGIPEVVVTQLTYDSVNNPYPQNGGNIFILNGKTGLVKKSLHVGYNLNRDPLIGNINNSNCGMIFVNDQNQYVYAYDCNLNLVWKSTKLSADPMLMGLADFDGDGVAELYCRDEILAAESGIRIVKGTNSSNASGAPVAVDILDAAGNVAGAGDNKLELVSGCKIFAVSLGARTLNSGSLTLKSSAANYYYWQSNGNTSHTSVADYNQDGFLDIVATGSTVSQSANATAFFWDVKNNAVKTYIDKMAGNFNVNSCPPSSGSFYANGWHNGIGRINIADIDGDGQLEASYISGKYMYALDNNFNQKWRINVNEETSGYTGCTVYDFNGDGAAEVVYRDEKYLYIINGNNGSINTQQQCIARTNFEYPVVADIDADGQTELCVTCGYNDANALANFCTTWYSMHSSVRAFSSASVPWVPSRKLWNQHAYFNVNVNDDLTIPKVMQKQLAVFSSGVCTVGANRALNSFLNQSPFLDSKGCPTYAAPDLVDVQSMFSVQQPVCPSTNFTVSMGVQNIGDASINGNVPVTFYKGDPTKAGAIKLNTVTIPVNLVKGQTQTFTGITVTGTGGPFTLYISLNDAGTSIPTPIVLPNTPFVECNYNNVISAAVTPNSVQVTAQKINDDVKCAGSAVADNGAAKAFVLVGGSPDVVDYTFNWYNGAVSGAPSYTGATYSGLGPGTYKVIAIYTATGCGSDTASVTIAQVAKAPMNVTIVVDKPNSSCATPNGQLHAVVNGGDPVINYTFQWFEGNDIFTSPQIGTGYVATSLKGGKTYTVLVTDNASGCQAVASLAVPDVTSAPAVTATEVDAVCVPVNSGSVSANIGGVTAGYTFAWSNGGAAKPSPDFTGSTYSSIPAGSYTVVATDNTSGCSSAAVTTTVNTPPPFTVTPSMASQQTSCNPATPNGSVTANVGGVTAGYTFNWFNGQSTAPADAIPGPTNLSAGTYTVVATNVATGCTASAFTTVTQNLIYPVVTLTPSPNSICNAALASSTYNGSVVATISYNGVPDGVAANYQFVWHQGSLATDPVIVGATSPTINQLNGGNYTLVVTRVGSTCAAPPATATVNNTTVLPALTTSETPSTNCTPALQNGVAQVTQVNGVAVGSTNNFNYQWYTGAGTASPIVGATNAQLTNVQGGAGNNYTVQVTDKTSGCQNTSTVLVGDASVLPLLSLSKTDNGVCDPALTSPAASYSGSVLATVTNQVGGLGGYNFAFGGGDTAPPVAVQTVNLYSNLNGGGPNYTVVATQVATGCVSSTYKIKVKNVTTLPAITASTVPSTNCAGGAPNGQASVTDVDGFGTGSPYVFAWYDGNSVAGPVKSTTKNYLNVQGGPGKDYTVQVTNQNTGCQNNSTVLVADNSVLPVLGPLSKTDNIFCAGSNGTAAIGSLTFPAATPVSAPYAGFTFAWSNGATTTNINALAAGTYSLTATNTATNCVSNPASVTVNNNQTLPTITPSTTSSTNCAGGAPNGSVDVTGVAPADTYTYKWYSGNAVGAAGTEINSPFTNPVASNLQGGIGKNYTVQVTLGSTGCQNTKTVLLGDNSVLPVLGPLSKTDNISCIGPNGTASIGTLTFPAATPVGAPYTGFTFLWSTSATTTSINSLAAGNYTLTATNTATNCASSPVSVTIINNQTPPTITSSTTPSTNCAGGAPNGSVMVTSVVPVDTYTYKWYAGSSVGAAGTELNNPFSNPTATGLQGGPGKNFTVQVTLGTTGCQNTETVLLADKSSLPTINTGETDNTNCSVAKNGTASLVTLNDPNGGGPIPSPFVGYSFSWNAGAFTTSSISNLASGTYTLAVTNTALNCSSAVATVTVADKITNPVIAVTVTDQTSCNVATPNGQLAATGDGVANATHTFIWYDGTGTGGAVHGQASTGLINSLASGNYTVSVTANATGCSATQTSFVPNNLVNPSLSFTAGTPVTKCNVPDGSTQATITGLSAPTNYNLYYDFTSTISGAAYPTNPLVIMAAGDPKNVLNGNSTPPPAYGGMIPGYLSAVVVDNNTQCESIAVTKQVADQTSKSTISVTIIPVPGTCGTGNGGIDPTVVSVPANDPSTGLPWVYTYQWYVGTPNNATPPPINFFNNSPTFGTGQIYGDNRADLGKDGGDATINPGTYTLVVKTSDGCGTYQTNNVPTSSIPTITVVPTPVTTCALPGNGALDVTVTAVANVNGYTVKIRKGNDITGTLVGADVTGPAPTINNNPTGLADGTYYIEVTDQDHPACKMGQNEILAKLVLPPIVTVNSVGANTFCNPGANGDGSVSLTVNNATGDVQAKAYEVSSIVAPLAGYGTPNPIGTGASGQSTTITGFLPTSYTINVMDNNSQCQTAVNVTIPDQPDVPSVLSLAITPETLCSTTNGSALASLQGGEPTTEFDFKWAKNNDLTGVVYGPLAGNAGHNAGELLNGTKVAPANWPVGVGGAGSGDRTYYVQGVKNATAVTGVGCETSIATVVIPDQHIAPTVNLIPFTNTSCDTNYEGKITVNASDSGGPGVGGTYTYTWNPANPTAIANSAGNLGAGDNTPANLKDGIFNMTATNSVTGCLSSSQTTILKSGTPIVVANAAHTDQQLCSPDGSITIGNGDVLVNGAADNNHNNFVFDWFANSPTPPTILTGASKDVLNILSYPTIGAGDYYVTATRVTGIPVGSGCKSAPLKVTIKDISIKPTVSLTPFTNTSCDTNYEGKITVNASDSGGPGFGATYTYTWDPANPVLIANSAGNSGLNNNTPANLNQGIYKLTVTNSITSCSTPSQTTILQSGTPIVVANAAHTDQRLCSPSGSITIGPADVLVNGVADPAHANFVFDWFANSPTPPTILTGASQDALNNLNYVTIGAGDYYVTATRATGVPVGSGCKSAPLKVTIKDISIKPTVSMTPFTNTSCDINYEGKITVNASDSGAGVGGTYTYTWDPANPVLIANSAGNSGVNNNTPANLNQGIYKLTVTNSITSCSTPSQTTILQSGTPIVVAFASHTDQQLCSPDGSITIGPTGVLVNGVADPAHANFVFDWFANSPTPPTILSGASQDALSILNYPTIGAGDYYVTATRATGVPVGSGCKSAPLKVTIKDVSVPPTVALTPFTNTACDANYEGKITINASDSGGPGVGANYTYTWDPANPTAVPAPLTGTGAGDTTPSNLKDGTYNVTVTNNVTSCASTAQTILLQSDTPILAIIATTQDQAKCNPDGKITVGNVTVDGAVDGNHNDFSFNWYQNSATPPPIVSGAGVDVLDVGNFPTMGKGTYYVTVTRKAGLPPGSGCTSPPLRVDINDVHVNPTIAAATINPNVNCAGGTGAGVITINEAAPLNYTYSWFAGDDTSGAPVLSVGGVNGEVAQSLLQGDYTVQVRSNTTNCVSTETYTISNNPTIVAFDPAGFSAPGVTTCTLATGTPSNGSATVAYILENSVNQPLTNYTFLWTDASNNTLQNGAAPTLANLPPGSYFVKATNTVSNCFADLSFKINDNTIGTTTVTLIDFGQPERCVNPQTGFLTVQGGGTVAGPYTYEWYTGDQRPTPAGAPLAVGSTLNNIPISANQIFTVKTINSNNCWAVDAYPIPLIVNPIVITASTNPLTYCTSDNGEVFSTIVNDNKFNYNFMWGKGNSVNPPVDYTTNDVTGLPAGIYTVVAIDKSDPGCISPTVTVTIDNDQIIPAVTAQVLQPLTICDPARPDGQASADVGGDVVHYTFDWFTGNSAAGTSFYRGAQVGNLTSITYTVLATETTTGCSNTASVTIPTNFAVIPAPTVDIISNVTSCIKDNGQLSASVGGVTKDYIFNWRDGTSAPPPIDFTGEIYSNLSVGQYTVTATSRITGCVSAPATAPIINEQQFPQFDFLIRDASCQDSDGAITIIIVDNVTVAEVAWYQNGTFVAGGPNLENAMAGTYQVTIVTTEGCQSTQNVILPANILPFNGVSRTADGKNDFFLIQCIENYPQNHVEIFNRAGTKVYEANGYDNLEVLFDGKSNRGVSIMGTNLPAGTYFYVISKGDGSKHMVGYLELVD